jgi:undecaprenyl-diphosphatase
MCAIVFALLGWFVSTRPPLEADRALENVFAGQLTGAAAVFTRSCYWYVLVSLGAALIALAFLAPAWRVRAIFSIVVTLVGWQASDLLKAAFRRPRPEQWYGIHETSYGYPSGHAMFATVVYGLWAYFVWNSRLPAPWRGLFSAALGLWAMGILWSRLALGAHYPGDLAGGVLLGAALLAAGFALVPAARSRSGA